MGANWRASINFWLPEGTLWSPKISPLFFSNKSLNMNEKCMVWTFLCSKIALLRLQIPENNCTCTSKALFIYLFIFTNYFFEDIKLSDLECRNRKLSAQDCIYHIKTLFSSNNYKTRNINRSHESNCHVARTSATTVPHYL